jgi:hypothetical protein
MSHAPAISARDVTTRLRPELTATTNGAPVLGGLTSGGWPVVLEVSSNGKRIRFADIGLDMNCSSGGSFSTMDFATMLAIRPNGTVHRTAALPSFTDPSGTSITGSRSISGRLNRKRWTFSGVWHLHLSFAMSHGQTDQCDSGTIPFVARRSDRSVRHGHDPVRGAPVTARSRSGSGGREVPAGSAPRHQER